MEFFDSDTRVENVPKRVFKTNREVLIGWLLELPRRVPININTIVAVINKNSINDPDVARIMEDRDVFEKRSDRQADDEEKYDLRIPELMSTFHADVMMISDETNREDKYMSAVNTIYSWIYNKFSSVLMALSKEVRSVNIEELGFWIKVDYRPQEKIFLCSAKHIDVRQAGRIWITSAIIMPDASGELRLAVDNGFTYFPNENDKTDVTRMFSCPRFYRQIVSQIGVRDVWELGNTHLVLTKEQADKMLELITSDYRTFPIVMLVSSDENDGRLDESWLGSFAIRYIQDKAGHYAHFTRVYRPMAVYMLEKVDEMGISYEFRLKESMRNGLIVIMPKKNSVLISESFSESHIANCSFASFEAIEHLQPFRQQDNGKAFGNELLTLLRRMNTEHEHYTVIR